MNSQDIENGLKSTMSVFNTQSKNTDLIPSSDRQTISSSHQQFTEISKNIQRCMLGIKKQKDMAKDTVHLKGWFKGKKRDEALADAIIASSDTQENTIILVKESIKFFSYIFSYLEGQLYEDRETNHKKQLEIVDFIKSFADDLDDNTKKYLAEIGSGLNSYNQKIIAKIKEQDSHISILSDTISETIRTSKELENLVIVFRGNLETMHTQLDSFIEDKCDSEKKIVKLTEQEAKLSKRIQKVMKVAITLVFLSLISIGITVFTLLKLLYLG